MSYFITNNGDGYALTAAGYIVSAILLVVVFLMTLFISSKRSCEKMFNVKKLVFCAMAVSLATAASIFKLFSFPFGGSVTFFSMLFICLIGYFYGTFVGITSGVAFGIITFILNPYILFPMQVLLDYIFSFAALGLSGIFSNSKYGLFKGYVVGVLGRYLFAVLSGWIFFGEYAWNGWGTLSYSLVYNGIYIFTEAFLTLIIICIPSVSKSIDKIKSMALL